MTRRKKIVITSIIVLVIIGLLWLVLKTTDLFNFERVDNINEVLEIETPSADFEFQPIDIPPVTNTEFTVDNLAKNYAARLGSWSTDNPGVNLEELLPLSSPSMRNYLQGIDINYSAEEFSGVTTKSISAEILSLSDSAATVMVSTQRIETDSNLQDNTYYQDIEIHLVKSGDEWLVSGAYWQ